MTDKTVNAESIELTDSRDIAFSKMAQGAFVQNTVLPSGLKTPDLRMRIKGTTLVPCSEAEIYRRPESSDFD